MEITTSTVEADMRAIEEKIKATWDEAHVIEVKRRNLQAEWNELYELWIEINEADNPHFYTHEETDNGEEES